jgi:large subunit ribosomal protein L15
MSKLHKLAQLVKKRKRVGRGGDRGGTSGRGHKGQKARSGPHLGISFEGGQMPLTRRLPKHGFTNVFKTEFEIVNLAQLNKFEAGTVVNREILIAADIIKGKKNALIKILGNGVLDKNIIVHADAFSKSAAQAITDKKGEVHVIKAS